jgi:two-component system, cell cycle response regulator
VTANVGRVFADYGCVITSFVRRAGLFFLVLGTAVLAVRCGIGGEGSALVELWLDRVLYNTLLLVAAALVLVRALRGSDRLAWFCIGSASLLWALGNTYYGVVLWGRDPMPFPSLADALWILFYVPAYAGVLLLARARLARVRHTSWLDGAIGGLGIAGVGAAVAFGTIVDATGGDRLAVATNLAYPLGDMVLLSLVVGVLAVTGWRPGRQWLLIAIGFSCFAISDTFYLFRIAEDTYEFGTLLDLGWLLALVLLSFAAWTPGDRLRTRIEGWQLLAAPVLFGLAGLAVLVYDHWTRVHVLALALATACIGALMLRLTLVFRDNLRMIRSSRHEALTDALTGLGNRRRLHEDLEETADTRQVLALFDLDGFKSYNDTFGHPAGDALLARLGAALEAAVGPSSRAYRMGGDEFCTVHTGDGDPALTVAKAAAALSERGEGFEISASYGFVTIPEEASDPSAALRAADQRMYDQKNGKRTSAGRQTTDALVRVLMERNPSLAGHGESVAELASEIGKLLLLPEHEIDQLVLAAELHDVGKVAIPDAILNKTGPLDADEWTFIHQHTVIGERILAAAPALSNVGALVRSSHERWDGTGYPDRLVGEQIPLGARIIGVCDAFDAMTSERPYRAAMTAEQAVTTLAENAGTQFDPSIVTAFTVVLERLHARRREAVQAGLVVPDAVLASA